jgi:hypothetical protein
VVQCGGSTWAGETEDESFSSLHINMILLEKICNIYLFESRSTETIFFTSTGIKTNIYTRNVSTFIMQLFGPAHLPLFFYFKQSLCFKSANT